jgi:hypothetical protein
VLVPGCILRWRVNRGFLQAAGYYDVQFPAWAEAAVLGVLFFILFCRCQLMVAHERNAAIMPAAAPIRTAVMRACPFGRDFIVC